MKVSLSGRVFSFPRQCCCCGAYPLTHLSISGSEKNRLSRTKSWIFEIPCCVACRKHILRRETILVGWLGAVVLSAIVGMVLVGLFDNWIVAIGLAVTLLSIATLLAGLGIAWLKSRMSKNCCGLGRPVIYLGSDRTCHSFDVKSTFYAKEFVIVNHSKLVNISPRVASLLRNVRFGDYQVPRRVIRRRN